MIGFIKGLFNSQPKSEETTVQAEVPAPAQKPSAYFLNTDDALTLGDIDYMRTAKAVKKTFPKVASLQAEPVESVVMTDAFGKPAAVETPALPEISVSKEELVERRSSDSNLDMFRSMARDIKKV